MGNSNLRLKPEEASNHLGNRVDWSIYGESTSDPNLFVALYDFHPEGANQLSLRRGEKVQVQSHDESSDWCIVKKNRKKGYVPTKYLARWTSLDKYPWFHSTLSRSAAEYLLRSEVEGSYLVRESITFPGQYCISLKSDGLTSHYKIEEESGLLYLVPEKRYLSLPDLIKDLDSDDSSGLPTKLTYAVPRKTKPTIYELCPGMPDKWELERSDLDIMERLGSGQYGDVYKARMSASKKLVAVKSLKDSVSVEEFAKEGTIMKTMKHPNLIQLLGMCSKRHPPYIVMEYMSNGNLLNFLRCRSHSELNPTVLVYMATQIAFAMTYLESKNYIHRDLAARNCLVGEDHIVKVADFGLARVVKEETYMCQSAPMLPIKWTAPEGLAFNVFSTKSDVWAFGILLFEIVTYGKTPYPSISLADVYPFLEQGGRMERPPDCPLKVYQLMLKCWEWNPENRPKFKDIHHELDDINCNNKGHLSPVICNRQKYIDAGPSESPSSLVKSPEEQTAVQAFPAGGKKELQMLGLKTFIKKNDHARPALDVRSNFPAATTPPELMSKMQFKDELIQKINLSEPSANLKQAPFPSGKGDAKFPAKERPNVQPPPVPTIKKALRAVTRPQVLPPPLPPKVESKLPSTLLRMGSPLPPSLPQKPVFIKQPSLPADLSRPTPPPLPAKPTSLSQSR